MEPMIQGTEHEYTMYSRKMLETGVDPHKLALELIRESDLHLAGEFVKNGSRVYWDVGHFEVSTCEVTNFMDLVVWEKAGEKILDWVRKVMEGKFVKESDMILAFKNNTAPDGTSYGSHENYCLPRKLDFPDEFVKKLAPHLMTRFIYTGAGDILDDKYVLSPCAYQTSKMVSSHTMHGTGVLNTRDEPHGDEERFRRLHVQIGDALMNETGIMLRNFTTSAILQLMAEGELEDVPTFANPLEDMWQNVEQTNPDKWSIELSDGKKSNPVEIQKYYLSKIESKVETDQEKHAFKTLEEILDDIEAKRSKKLARKVEWLDRYFAIQDQVKIQPEDPEVEMKACKAYSEIAQGRSLHYKRERNGLIDRQINDQSIIKAIYDPPSDTRASLRRKLCDQYEVMAIDWAYITIKKDETPNRIDLDDPMATELKE
jgi:proteasome accessory factor A